MKTCPKCGEENSDYSTQCFKCYTTLNPNISHDYALHVVSFLIPWAGIVIGCVYISKNQDEYGKSLIITATVSVVVTVVLAFVLGAFVASMY